MYTELQQPLLQFCTNNSGVLRGGGTSPPKIVKLKLNHTPSGKEKEQLVCLSNIIFFFWKLVGFYYISLISTVHV